MSDRRPEKLYRLHPNNNLFEASPADLLAAVRRGVESGTIKGELVEAQQFGWVGVIAPMPGPGTYLVIPVSDGEEDK